MGRVSSASIKSVTLSWITDDVDVKISACTVPSLAAEDRMLRVPPTLTFSKSSGRMTMESGQAIWKMVRGRASCMALSTASDEDMSHL